MKLGTIDIGTHSVLLLIVEKKSDGSLVSLADEATLTRIGEGMGKTTDQGPGTLRQSSGQARDQGPTTSNVFLVSAMERTLNVLKKYKTTCDQHGAEKIMAVGTAAFRRATNAQDFVKQVQKECGIAIEIISGEREAHLTWKAASTDFGRNILVVDIGGGSTEIITTGQWTMDPSTSSGHSNGLWTKSMPIGSVLLTEKYCHSDPISKEDYQALCNKIDKHITSLNISTSTHQHIRTLVATAGTATTLGAIQKKMTIYKHAEVHGTKLTIHELEKIIADFKAKTIEERKKIPGLEPGRADVILAGSTLLAKIAKHFGFEKITLSDRGVRWGLVYEQLTKN